jgi:hypothetical protein
MNRNVMAAYHTICTKCAVSDAAVKAMEKHQGGVGGEPETNEKPIGADDIDSVCDAATNEEDTIEEKLPGSPNEQGEPITTNKVVERKRKIKVCAMCTHEPALSKYDNMPPEASELVSQITELEDVLESGVGDDGHKLTLREVRTLERQVEKLRVEIKEFGKKKCDDDEDDNEDGDEEQEDDSENEDSVDDESDGAVDERDEEDPFLKAVGGKEKLLVGDAYQQMLLAKAEAQK